MSRELNYDIIVNDDLYEYDYDIHTLEFNVLRYNSLPKNEFTRLNLRCLLRTQKLTAEFCIKYILNDEYAYTDSEESITTRLVLYYQPHLTYKELHEVWNKIYKS